MPELPEVETIARTLRPQLIGSTILEADLRWARTLAAPSARKFKAQIKGQRIEDVTRRAKFLWLRLSKDHLLIHLRMSGDLHLKEDGYQPQKHDRLILTLAPTSPPDRIMERKLVFTDTRKFGRVWLTADAQEIFGGLGPEPLEDQFTARHLYQRLRARRRRLKPLLLDQTFIAGLGNIYADEALHRARLHPLAASDSITAQQAERLWQAIRETLQDGIRSNGASIDWVYRGGDFQNYFRVYRRQGQPCPVCGTRIERIMLGQRGAHFCPNCQKE